MYLPDVEPLRPSGKAALPRQLRRLQADQADAQAAATHSIALLGPSSPQLRTRRKGFGTEEYLLFGASSERIIRLKRGIRGEGINACRPGARLGTGPAATGVISVGRYFAEHTNDSSPERASSKRESSDITTYNLQAK
jgi:hypothetical protein